MKLTPEMLVETVDIDKVTPYARNTTKNTREIVPQTHRQAVAQGSVFYNTGKPCKRGHYSMRLTANGACCECDKLFRQEFRQRYHTETLARTKTWKANNAATVAALEKVWRENNRGKKNASNRQRQARQINAVPNWHTEWDAFVMDELYDLAQRKTLVCGQRYVVDHVIPLQGDTVCGLHTPTNLQVITSLENGIKHNKWEV